MAPAVDGKGGGEMDEHRLARMVGWVSLGLGLALVASPARTVKQLGMGERPNLGRLLGARDLVLGAGLLRSESTATWLRARGIADALDAALILGGASLGAFPRSRAPVGLATATGFAGLSFLLARRLDC
jgi:hypothetical protein